MPSWTSSESRVISDDDLQSKYYKELLYGMLQNQKKLKKHVDYEELINVLAMDKSRLEEELRVTKTKMKLYESLVAANASKWVSKCKQMGKQPANASCNCKHVNASCNCKLHLQTANACLQPTNACLQPANACLQPASFNCKMQMQAAKACLQPANASLQPTSFNCKL
ncbi:hypothetical protein Tco_0052669 [Tanacetum coccineum]